MTSTRLRPVDRWILALVLIAIDAVVFVVPLTGLLAAYLLVVRPAWFREWVLGLYDSP
jgi:hypothetical protein